MRHYFKVLLISLFALGLTAPVLRSQDVGSHARMVRISYLEGTVQLNGERASMNSAIREGLSLRTDTDGLAEVQFEDGATIRMASETQITFAQLARLTSGDAITRVDLDDGEAEFLIPASSAGRFAVNARNKNMAFNAPGRYRILSTNASPLEIAVWKGEVTVRDRESGKEIAVKKNETFTLNPSDPGQYDLENALLADDLDQWSNMRDQALNSVTTAASSYSYSNPYGYASPAGLSAPPPFYTSGYAYGCSPWGFGWGFDPYGSCFNSGFYQPWFFPPTPVFIVTPIGVPRRPPHIHPPTVPTVAVEVPTTAPQRPVPVRQPVVAGVESGSMPVKPGVHSFRFEQGFQRTFNEDNFQHSVPQVENAASGQTVVESTSHVQPVVAPGHRSPSDGSTAPFKPIPTVAPPPNTAHSPTPSTPSRPAPSSAPRSASPPASSGSHGFSGGSMPSHSSSPSSGSSSHSGGSSGHH